MTIEERMARLETKFDERWDSHDRRSEENWHGIKERLDSICGRKDECMQEAKGYTHKMILLVLSLPAAILAAGLLAINIVIALAN